jgi:hypothetical protein
MPGYSRAALERLSDTERIIILEEQVRQEVSGFQAPRGPGFKSIPAGGEHHE